MYYELYIDVFFLENFMLDSLLLMAVNRVMQYRNSYARMLAGGAAGSFLTCVVIALPLMPAIKTLLFGVGINSVMIFAGLGGDVLKKGRKQSKKELAAWFLRTLIVLYAAAVVFGGAANLFRPYMKFAGVFYAVFAVGYFAFTGMWKFISRIRQNTKNLPEVTLYTSLGVKKVIGLIDTGNELRDFASDDPVNIIDPRLAESITTHPEWEKGFHMIPYSNIGGDGVMKVFRIEKMCIHMDEDIWIENPLLGMSERTLSEKERYEMILNPGIFL